MAMRPRRRGGRATLNRPPRLAVGPVYEDFKPMSEWRQEDDYDTLLLYLPGFQKEYIKVTTEDMNIVRVRGERLIAENKWSRFQEDFRVPENCEMRGIRAKFDGGILTITMPRKIISSPDTTATQVITPKAEEPPFTRTKQEEESKERATTSSNANLESKKKPDDKPQTPTLPPQPMTTKQEPLKPDPEAKEADGEFTFGSISSSVNPTKDKHDVAEKPNDKGENRQKGVAGKTDLDEGKVKRALLEEEKKMDLERRNDGGVTRGGFGGDKLEEKKVVKGIGRRGMNEEMKMVVNMGVGVLVIVALGVHVSYTIGLIGKGK